MVLSHSLIPDHLLCINEGARTPLQGGHMHWGKKDRALTTESLEASPQIVRQPHELLGADSTGEPLSVQTSSSANVAPLVLLFPYLGPYKTPPLSTKAPHCVETCLPLRGSRLSPPKLAPQGAPRHPVPSPLMASGSCAHPWWGSEPDLCLIQPGEGQPPLLLSCTLE